MDALPTRRAVWCGKHWIHLEQVDSTNDYLKRGDFPDGTAVLADRQVAGKGRQGKSWSGASAGQAMYLSVLFHSMKISDMGLLPLLCGLAAARSLGESAQIKWPNDVLLGGKKAVGILCESKIQGSEVCAICGIGINLTQPAEFFAENDLPYGTSVRAQTGETRTAKQAAGMLLDELEPILDQYRREGFSPILPAYCSRCVTLGRQVRVFQGQQPIVAQAKGIAPDGGLICEKQGVEFIVRAGEASVRGLYGYI